ncbi:MAG: hypothetical protein QF473_40450, partial [Planctomycetota bacterium]|nr:hypothetical protein [Planctomycetota bacterium]
GLLLAIIVWAAVRSTHKVAGPMVPICRALQRVTEGDYSTTVRLRKDDWLHELADQMNETFDAVQKRHQSMERRIVELAVEAKNHEEGSRVEGIPESIAADA